MVTTPESNKTKPEIYPSCPYPRLTLDTAKYKLGHVCPSLHDFGNGQSMRLISNNQCFECRRIAPRKPYQERKEYFQNYQKKNREKSREATRRYRERNPNQGKKYYQHNQKKILARTNDYKRANRDRIRLENRSYYQANKATRLQRIKDYSLTPAGKAKAIRYQNKRKAMRLSNHHQSWTNEQREQRLKDFNSTCAYCGSTEHLALDHFIPLSRGGPDCMGNLVVACRSCNASKNASDPKDWYRKHRSYSVKRWKHILKILGLNNENHTQLPLF